MEEFGTADDFNMDEVDVSCFKNRHYMDVKGDMNAKGIGNQIPNVIKKLSGSKLELFNQSAFGVLSGIKQERGGAVLMHGMFLREVIGDESLVAQKRFRFEVAGQVLEYGEREFVLLTGFKHGHYRDILEGKMHGKSAFASRLFPETLLDKDLMLQDFWELINNVCFPLLSDEDAVLAVMVCILLKCLMGRELRSYIPPFVLALADDLARWNSFAWGTYLWTYTYGQMSKIFQKLEDYDQDVLKQNKKRELKYTVLGYMFPFKIWIWESLPAILRNKYVKWAGAEVLPRIRAWEIEEAVVIEWRHVLHIFEESKKPENMPIQMTPRELELKTPYFSRYLRWQEPDFVPSPPCDPPRPEKQRGKKKRPIDTSSPRVHEQRHPQNTEERGWVKKIVGVLGCLQSDVSEIKMHIKGSQNKSKKTCSNEEVNEDDTSRPMEEDTGPGNQSTGPSFHETTHDGPGNQSTGPSFHETTHDYHEETGPDFHDNHESVHDFHNTGPDILDSIPSPYVIPRPPIVDVASTTPAKVRRTERVPVKAACLKSPYGQVDSTPPVVKVKIKQSAHNKNRKKKKVVRDSDTVQDDTMEVENPRLLDIYMTNEVSFWLTLQTLDESQYAQGGLFRTHRLYNCIWDWYFWGRLIGKLASGWLDAWHVDLWMLLMTERRRQDDRWRVMPTTFMRPDKPDDWATCAAGLGSGPQAGVVGPPWWKVDRLLIPINIPDAHWFLAEVDLKRWKVTIYDSLKGHFRHFEQEGRFAAFCENLKVIMDVSRYWHHLPKRTRRLDMMEFVEAEVPQQKGPLGDCGVFVCMFMEMLACREEGAPLEYPDDPISSAHNFRYRMASIFWGSR